MAHSIPFLHTHASIRPLDHSTTLNHAITRSLNHARNVIVPLSTTRRRPENGAKKHFVSLSHRRGERCATEPPGGPPNRP
eukprot:8857150-Pyramimonas_sp.AAC.1